MAPKLNASSQIAVNRAPSTRPVVNAQAPASTTPAIPIRMMPAANAVTRADIRKTRRQRDSTSAARRANSRSTYGWARLVRTSSWPCTASSITAARSDQASSSAIRAGAMAAVGRRSSTPSSAVSSSMATPAGHQTNNALTAASRQSTRPWMSRTPVFRSSAATW